MKKGKGKNFKFLPILILLLVVGVFVGIGFVFVRPSKKEISVDEMGISKELQKDKKYLDLTLQDIELEDGEKLTHLMANVYNHGEAFQDRMVNIVFLDVAGKEIGKAPTYISEIEKDGVIRIDTVIDKKCAKAYTFKVEEYKS